MFRRTLLKWLTKSYAPPDTWKFYGYSHGHRIGYEAAYEMVGWVHRCIRAISTNIQQVPFYAAKRTVDAKGNARYTRLPDIHPLQALLLEPNYEEDFKSLLEMLAIHLMCRGEGLWELETNPADGDRIPTRIFSYPPQYIQKADINNNQYQSFDLVIGAKKFTIPANDCVFFKLANPSNPWRGLAPMRAAFMAAETDYNAQRFNHRWFEMAPAPAMVLTKSKDSYATRLNPDDREKLRAEFSQLYAGVDHSQSIMTLGPGEAIETIGLSKNDMAFANMRRFNRDEIQAVFGVPPILAGDVEDANKSNSAEQRSMFWQDTMLPIVEDINGMMNRKLARRYEPGVVIHADIMSIPAMQDSLASIIKWAVPSIGAGLHFINEIRHDYLKKPPVPWGDLFWRNNLTVATDSDEMPTPSPTPSGNSDAEESKIAPDKAKALLTDWKERTHARLRSGADDPVNAFPCGREARFAVTKYGVPYQAAWQLSRALFGELALVWDANQPTDAAERMFDGHIKALPKG